MNSFTIGQLAGQAGVNVETIRYYERIKLIPKPPRLDSGYRRYSTRDVARVRFIKRAQSLGFSLKEVADLLALRIRSDTVCQDVQAQAETKIAEIDEKIQTLQQMRNVLFDLVQACVKNQLTTECPILNAIDEPQNYE